MSLQVPAEAFHEDAISDYEVYASCDRFLISFDHEGIVIRLCQIPDARRVNLVSKEQALTLVDRKMDAGVEVWVEG